MTGFGLLALGTPASMLFGLPMTSLSSGSNQSLSTALVGDLSSRAVHGRRLGVLFTVGDLASAVGPPIAYALIPLIGLSAIYGIAALLLGSMMIAAVIWANKQRTAPAMAG